ncbi:MAG: hypothetical protein KME06_07810 [Kastovskya adunca ATA6-11-RM4]|nr:hypothetical protein [Kastovskya adunca ATA6-11-RM4]
MATNTVSQVVTSFKTLSEADQLGAMALIFQEKANDIPTEVKNASVIPAEVIAQMKELAPEEQLKQLSLLLSNDIGIAEYKSLDAASKLTIWTQIAQELGNTFPALTDDYRPTAPTMDVLNAVKSFDREQFLSFLSDVI